MTKKKALLVTAVVILVLGGLIAIAGNRYNQRKATTTTETLSHAQRERDTAVKQLIIVKAVDKVNLDTANAQATSLRTQLTSVCASLKTTKVVNANCR